MRIRGSVLTGMCVAAAALGAAPATAAPPLGVDMSCVAPAAARARGTREWVAGDTKNQYCGGLRTRDQLASPAFGFGNLTQGAALYAEQTTDQLAGPGRRRGGVPTRSTGAKPAAPFRTINRWPAAGRARVAPVSFKALDGATL